MMKRVLSVAIIAMAALSLACEPFVDFPEDDDNNTETPVVPSEPEQPSEPEEPENPAPVALTASLTYDECEDAVTGYGKANPYTNSYGTWVVCAYGGGGNIQLNDGKVAYVGTPTFASDITKVKLVFSKSYSDDIYLCTVAGTTAEEGIFETIACSGSSVEYTLTKSGHKSLYIRSGACANIDAIYITYGGTAGGTTPEEPTEPEQPTEPEEPTEPEQPAEPEDPSNPSTGRPSENWLELPVADNGVLYPNAVEVKVSADGERNYTILYDKSTYTSMWVAYPLESKHMGSLSRPKSWSFNPLLPESCQVDLCSGSYTNGTHSRGHLIPNASRNGIRAMQLQTFYVTNSVPQLQTRFNDGVWNNLENAMQSIASSEKIYIVTGVAFSKVGESRSISYTTARNDSKQVPIPNYFYKIALKVNTNSSGVVTSASTIGFWFENKEYTTSYTSHTVSVDQIEQWTGFDFYGNLPDGVESSAERNSSWSSFSNF